MEPVAWGEEIDSAGTGAALMVSVVIPTLDEERNIGWVLERLPAVVDEVIIVDGRSTDGTVAAARAARPDVRVVYELRRGKGAALRAGFAAARGDVIVMLDADGSMHPAELVRYVELIGQGYDLVKGSRFLPGGGTADISRLRAAGNLALLGFANWLFYCEFTELCYGFMALRRSAVPRLRLTADGFEIETQIVASALRERLRVAEVPSFEAARRNGVSNLRTFRDGSRVLRELVRASRPRPVVEVAPDAVATLAVALPAPAAGSAPAMIEPATWEPTP
jgi:glycosyltransferase involved in cell wall biosynthesis